MTNKRRGAWDLRADVAVFLTVCFFGLLLTVVTVLRC